MFDQDDGNARLCRICNQLRQFAGFGRVAARRGFVQQQNPRLRREGPRDFKLFEFAIGQIARDLVLPITEANPREQCARRIL